MLYSLYLCTYKANSTDKNRKNTNLAPLEPALYKDSKSNFFFWLALKLARASLKISNYAKIFSVFPIFLNNLHNKIAINLEKILLALELSYDSKVRIIKL